MRAMRANAPGRALALEEVPVPVPGQVLVKVSACGVCRTDLHVADGERARFTGCDLDGGYAEYVLADERYCLPIPERYGCRGRAAAVCGPDWFQELQIHRRTGKDRHLRLRRGGAHRGADRVRRRKTRFCVCQTRR